MKAFNANSINDIRIKIQAYLQVKAKDFLLWSVSSSNSLLGFKNACNFDIKCVENGEKTCIGEFLIDRQPGYSLQQFILLFQGKAVFYSFMLLSYYVSHYTIETYCFACYHLGTISYSSVPYAVEITIWNTVKNTAALSVLLSVW